MSASFDPTATVGRTAEIPREPLRERLTSRSATDLFRSLVEGWPSLASLLVMVLAVAWAIDDAGWAGIGAGDVSQTSFLAWAVTFGVLWGYFAARSRLPTGLAHLIGASVAAGFLLLALSGVVSEDPDAGYRLGVLNESLSRFYADVFVEGIRSPETTAFLLVLGAICWTTAQFSAFNLFRRNRTLVAIAAPGMVLLANMSITIRPQLAFLVVFAGAALVLLMQRNLAEQREGWLRRRIGDAGYVSSQFVRSGTVFVGAAVLGALVLAISASSAPLAASWRGVDDDLVRLGNDVGRFIGGVSGPARGPTGLFGTTQTIRGVWQSSNEPVFQARTSDGRGQYWRAAIYDAFDGRTWQQLERTPSALVPAGESVLGVTPESVDELPGRRALTATITSIDMGGSILVTPDAPLTVDRQTSVFTNTPGGPFLSIETEERLEDGETYEVTAAVRTTRLEDGGVTGNQLAAAGVDYPSWVKRYVDIRQNSIGERTRQAADRIVDALPEDERTPYHVTDAVQRYLYSSGGFRYETDVRGLCGNELLVDCFMRTKVGYCEYFATAMVMLLRTQEIPARIAMGYLPGRELEDGSWVVDRAAAHAWVEVFFPGHGWVRFDPTPGNQGNGQRPTILQPGPPVPTPTPAPDRSPGARPTPNFDRDLDEEEGIGGTSSLPPGLGLPGTPSGDPNNGPAGLLVLVGILAAIGLALGSWWATRSTPVTAPEVAYRSMTRLARRFGYGPQPQQTVYEYAGTLADLMPSVRAELQVVAQAKVEATYARRAAESDALEAVRHAYRRIRVGLLRLAVRMAGRPGQRRRIDQTRRRP